RVADTPRHVPETRALRPPALGSPPLRSVIFGSPGSPAIAPSSPSGRRCPRGCYWSQIGMNWLERKAKYRGMTRYSNRLGCALRSLRDEERIGDERGAGGAGA